MTSHPRTIELPAADQPRPGGGDWATWALIALTWLLVAAVVAVAACVVGLLIAGLLIAALLAVAGYFPVPLGAGLLTVLVVALVTEAWEAWS